MNQLRDMWWSSRESCNRTFGSDVRATTRSSNEQGTRSRSGEEKSRLAFVWRCQAVFGEAKKEPFVRSFVRRCHLVASLLLLLPVTLCCIDISLSLYLAQTRSFTHSIMSRPPLAATSSGRLQGVGDGTRAPSLTTSNSSSSLPKKPKPAPSRPAATTSAVKPKAGVASTSSTKPSAKASSSSTTSAARGNRAQTTASGGAAKKPAAAAKKKPVESSSSEEEYEEEIVVMIIQDGEECEAFVGSDDEYEYEVVEEIEEYVDVEDEEISDEALFDRYNPLLSAAAAAKRLAAALVEEQDEEDAEEGSEFVKRLVDYFVVCGLSDSMALDEGACVRVCVRTRVRMCVCVYRVVVALAHRPRGLRLG